MSAKINTNNYFEMVEGIGTGTLPQPLRQAHAIIMIKTDNGKDWSLYKSDDEFKKMADTAFKKLGEYIVNASRLNGPGFPFIQEPPSFKLEANFITHFLALDGHRLSKQKFGKWIDELQREIIKGNITKFSPLITAIRKLQSKAVGIFNRTKAVSIQFRFKKETIRYFKAQLKKAREKVLNVPEIKIPKKGKKSILHGVPEDGYASSVFKDKNGTNLMRSEDFMKMEFKTLGFQDKWKNFIGDPARGFTMMVFGMPKYGKSFLCVEFANYLAANHGKVLYVAKEEKLYATLQEKFKSKGVHPNITIADGIPTDLSDFEFVFLDSVNKLKLNPEDLEKLKAANPEKSFIYIFQCTKGGKFRGNNEFQHDVDIVVELPEVGVATQYGRYNAGGKLTDFLPEHSSPSLNGKEADKEKEIKASFQLYLSDLSIILNDDDNDLFEVIDEEPERVEEEGVYKAEEWIKKSGATVKVKKVVYNAITGTDRYNDSAIFTVFLRGTEKELKKVAGDRKQFDYDWRESLSGPAGGNKKKVITAEHSIPLEDLAKGVIKKGEEREELFEIIINQVARINAAAKRDGDEIIKDANAKVNLLQINFKETDSNNFDHGFAWFTIKLEGTEKELRKVAGPNKIFYHEWRGGVNGIKPVKSDSGEPQVIEAEYSTAFNHFAPKVIKQNKDETLSDLFKIAATNPERLIKVVTPAVESFVSGTGVRIKKIEFSHFHPPQFSRCNVHFKVTLEGTKNQLKSIVGESDKEFNYDWSKDEELEGTNKRKTKTQKEKKDWGGEQYMGKDPRLEQISPDDLDLFEKRMYNDFKSHGHGYAMQLIINSVEGDFSQLSEKIAEVAEAQEKDADSPKNEDLSGGKELPTRLNKSFIDYSISQRTLNPEDLIATYCKFLELVKVEAQIQDDLKRIKGLLIDITNEDERQRILAEEIIPLLENIAPEGTSFGSHPGDGSDFGFWKNESADSLEGGKRKFKSEDKTKETMKDKKKNKMDLSKYDNRKDEINPRYMFSTTATQLLAEAARGEIDLNYLVRKELANRGVDLNGKWVGFPKAKEIHQID